MQATTIKGRARLPMSRCGRPHESGIVRKFCFFDGHVFEFAGFEDFTALQAFDEFFVFLAGHDLHTRVLALCHVTSLLGELGRRGWSHKSGCWISLFRAARGFSPEFGGILDRLEALSSPSIDLSGTPATNGFGLRGRFGCLPESPPRKSKWRKRLSAAWQ